MLITSVVVASLLLLFATIQVVMALGFRHRVKTGSQKLQHAVPEGMASVLLSVRGCDPTLRKSLIGLLDQDYENYEIHVVVDNEIDAAWKVVHEIKEEFDLEHRLTIHEMKEPQETCGLKCSALLQALEAVSPDAEFLAFLDADVTPHKGWLNSVLAPLSDPEIGAVTGNQWFEPVDEAGAGSLIRSLWNAGAIVPTAMYANPWAGTCALRVKDVYRSGLDQIWRQSVVDDGPIRAALAPLGMRVYFEPSLIMVNREQCSVGYVNGYVSRMLTWSKLYEKTFANTMIHATLSNGVLVMAAIFFLVGLILAQWAVALISGVSIIGSLLISLIGYLVVRDGVMTSRPERQTGMKLTLFRLIQLTVLIPYTQMVYGISCFKALKAKEVKWREITYEVKSKSQVRMLSYSPFQPEAEYAKSEMSI